MNPHSSRVLCRPQRFPNERFGSLPSQSSQSEEGQTHKQPVTVSSDNSFNGGRAKLSESPREGHGVREGKGREIVLVLRPGEQVAVCKQMGRRWS